MITVSAIVQPEDMVLLNKINIRPGEHYGFGFINYNGVIGVVIKGQNHPYFIPAGGSVEFVCNSTNPTNLEMG